MSEDTNGLEAMKTEMASLTQKLLVLGDITTMLLDRDSERKDQERRPRSLPDLILQQQAVADTVVAHRRELFVRLGRDLCASLDPAFTEAEQKERLAAALAVAAEVRTFIERETDAERTWEAAYIQHADKIAGYPQSVLTYERLGFDTRGFLLSDPAFRRRVSDVAHGEALDRLNAARDGVIVNGKLHAFADPEISYEDAVTLAGMSGTPSVTWRISRTTDGGILHAGERIPVRARLVVNVAHTGDA